MHNNKSRVLQVIKKRIVDVNWRRASIFLLITFAVFLIVLAIGFVYAVENVITTRPIRFESSFESGGIRCWWCKTDGWWIRNHSGQKDAMVVGKEFPVRDGEYSLRVHAEKDYAWDPKPQLELSGHRQPFFETNTEYWMGMSIYLPDDGGYEFAPGHDVLLQVHGDNDECDTGGMGPPHALRPADGRWRWDVKWDPNECMGNVAMGREIIDIGPQERGRWTDFVIRWVFSHEDDGITQVWRDGELVVDRVGMPNNYNNAKGPFLKVGFYSAGWLKRDPEITIRTIYFDSISVYEGTDGYEIVDPAN